MFVMFAIFYFLVGILATVGLVTCFRAFLDWLDDYGDEIDLSKYIDLSDHVYPAPEKPAKATKARAKHKPSKRVKK